MVWPRPLAFAFLLAAGLLVAALGFQQGRCESPRQAEKRAEMLAPSLGLPWGKLRAFARREQAWELVYQPAHGAWLLQVVVPDWRPPQPPKLALVSWLPGGRLSLEAARFLAGEKEVQGLAQRPARWDWWFAQKAVFGALPAVPVTKTSLLPTSWAFGLGVGLLLAGAVSRRLGLHPHHLPLRRLVLGASLAMLAAIPGASQLAVDWFIPGIRPFVNLAMLATLLASLLGLIAAAAYLFPVFSASPRWSSWAFGALAGWTAGVLAAPLWAQSLAGVRGRWLWLLAAPVLAAYVLDLAGSGAGVLLSPLGKLQPWAAAGAAAASLAWGETWGLPLAAVFLSRLGPAGQSFFLCLGMTLSFLPGVWWATMGYAGPLRDSLLMVLALVAFLALGFLGRESSP